MTKCYQTSTLFSPVKRRKVEADFTGGDISSNGGVLLLAEVDKRSNLSATIVDLHSSLTHLQHQNFMWNQLGTVSVLVEFIMQMVVQISVQINRHLGEADIPYRRAYTCRHTYSSLGLTAGAKPGFMAKQLGHSLKIYFDTYANYMESKDDQRELREMERF